MHSHRARRATPAVGNFGDVPGLRFCIAAHLPFGSLVTRGHRFPSSRHFRTLDPHRGGDAVAASIVERHSDRMALHALAAGDFGIRSRIHSLRDSCRLADDAQLGIILWMSEPPPTGHKGVSS